MENEVFDFDKEIDIKEVLYIIKRKFWLIIILMAVFSTVGFFYSTVSYEPVYTANASMVVNSKQIKILDGEAQLTNDIYLSEKMVNTYQVILLSDRLLTMVNEDLHEDYNLDQMRSWIKVSSPKDTEVILVEVTNNNPSVSVKIANSMMKYAPKVISDTVEVGSINVVDYAKMPKIPEAAKTNLNVLIGGVLGLFLGVLIVLTIEFMFPKVKNKEDICSKLGLQIFTEIPTIKEKTKGELSNKLLLISDDVDIKFKEAFSILDLRIKYLEKQKPIKKILVTSALEKEGKTTVSINLAMLLAKEGKNVLFLESDMYRPNIIKKLKKEKKEKKMFKDLLQDDISVEECIVKAEKFGVDIISAGHIEESASSLFNTSKIKKIFKKLEEKYDYIVIDTPPAYILSDAISLSRYADAIFMVIRQEHANINVIKDAKENFESLGIEIDGAILNDIRYSGGDYKYKYKYKYKYDHNSESNSIGGNISSNLKKFKKSKKKIDLKALKSKVIPKILLFIWLVIIVVFAMQNGEKIVELSDQYVAKFAQQLSAIGILETHSENLMAKGGSGTLYKREIEYYSRLMENFIHSILFFCFSVLSINMCTKRNFNVLKTLKITTILVMIVSIGNETFQSFFIEGRIFEYIDIAMAIVGMCVAYITWFIQKTIKKTFD